jgi:parvulin-like peptidyl-prolyl isomerase
MTSQTARRPGQQRSSRTNKTKKYVRQTAHVEARRDGKPLIFGWGGHLSHSEKNLIKRRAIWATFIAFAVIIVFIFVAFWVNLNVITPNLAITSVNGQNITQADYRKMLAVKTQLELNKLNGPNGLNAQSSKLNNQSTTEKQNVTNLTNQVNNLTKQVNAAPTGSSQRANLQKQLDTAKSQLTTAQNKYNSTQSQYQTLTQNTIPNEQQLFTQSQYGNDSAHWLQENILIVNWLNAHPDARAKVEPSASSINAAVNNFKANLPKGTSYSSFLNSDHLSDTDVRAMLTVIQRRTNMQNYLAAQIKSPAYQVEARAITLSTQQDAQSILTQLQHGANFATLAKQKSVDQNTKNQGGDLGWMAQGQYTNNYADNISAVVDNWLFAPGRKVNELSPILQENGTWHIVQITSINPSRPIAKSTLQSLQNNALTAWLLSQKALPSTKITSVNQTMLMDSNNMPTGLPAGAPAVTPTVGGTTSGTPTPY